MGSGLENKEDEGESVGAMGVHLGGGVSMRETRPEGQTSACGQLRQESPLAVLQTGIA